MEAGGGARALGASEPGAAWLTMGAGLAENSFEREEEVHFRAPFQVPEASASLEHQGGSCLETAGSWG